MVLGEVEGLLLRAPGPSVVRRTVDVEAAGVLLLALAAAVEVRLTALHELLLVRELLVERVGLDTALAALALPADRLPALLGGPPGVRRRIAARVAHENLGALSRHYDILLFVLHLIDLLLHSWLVAAHRLVRHELLLVQVRVGGGVLLLLGIALAHEVLLTVGLILAQVLVLRVPAVLARVLYVLVLAAAGVVGLRVHR